jgi:type VI secretion system protein ImpH
VWDRQNKFRIHLGPLTLRQYEDFLPGSPKLRSSAGGPAGERLTQLVDWVRLYLCYELDWDVRLRLRHDQVPPLKLGSGNRLGWTTWIGRRRGTDADDLCLNAEAFVQHHRVAA